MPPDLKAIAEQISNFDLDLCRAFAKNICKKQTGKLAKRSEMLKSLSSKLFSAGWREDGENSGLRIESVIPKSPADLCKALFPGDRIIEVAGVSIISEKQSVVQEAYRNSTSPVQIVVQSRQLAKVCYRK